MRTFENESALTLAARISSHLIEAQIFVRSDSERICAVVGKLRLRAHGENSGEIVTVSVVVRTNWMTHPPDCWAFASFLHRDVDWHVYPDGQLCYVYPKRWALEIQRFNARQGDELDYAAGFCISAVDSLLVRHLIRERLKLQQWPSEWADYKHGGRAERQFQKEIKNENRF